MLGIGDIGISSTAGDSIKTLAFGSCIVLVLLHSPTRAIGMVHVAMPDSSINKDTALVKPGYFVDTGVKVLLERMMRQTGAHSRTGFIVKMIGGAQVLAQDTTFNIGRRNELAIKKLLWDQGMGVHAEDVGGYKSRNVTAEVDTGRIIISSAGRGSWEL